MEELESLWQQAKRQEQGEKKMHDLRRPLHLEVPRLHRRGEGSGACRRSVSKHPVMLARSLARLKSAALRDDAFDRGHDIEYDGYDHHRGQAA
jgi:hypothetical protein